VKIKDVIHFFEQLFYPLKCLKCGVYIDPDTVDPYSLEACFCDRCMAAGFYPMTAPFCPKCGVKFQQGVAENHLCEACLKTPLVLDRVRAVAEYKGITKEAIQLFKYHSKLAVARVFERLLFRAFLDYYATARIDLIMPVPLHRKKLRQRGFNQAYLVIRNFVKLYQHHFGQRPLWRIDMGSLVRLKQTPSQTGFDIEQRKRNLNNAFKVVTQEPIDKQHILLIDDVFTTGATCNEAARELLNHGAGKVYALVIART
jgi:ComF family protein